MAFALTPYPDQGYKVVSKHYPTALKTAAHRERPRPQRVVGIIVLNDSPDQGPGGPEGKRIVPGDRGWGTTDSPRR